MDKAVKGAMQWSTHYSLAKMREVHAVQHSAEDKCREQLSQTMVRIILQLQKWEGQLKADKHRHSDAVGTLFENHLQHLENVLIKLGDVGLKLSPTKC